MSVLKLAVLLGNQIYDGDYKSLESVPNDLFLMKERLEHDGWIIWFALNFDSRRAKAIFEDVCSKALSAKNAGRKIDLLVYYAGHGVSDESAGWKPVLREEGTKNLDLIGAAMDLAKNSSGIARVFALLDSCESAQMSANALARGRRETSAPPLFAITSGWRDTYETQESGVFTRGLINCLALPAEEFPKTWGCLRNTLNEEIPVIVRQVDPEADDIAECELFLLGNAESNQLLPFSALPESWPTSVPEQTEFIIRNAEPHLAFGAIFGSSKMPDASPPEFSELRPDILAAASSFGIDLERSFENDDLLWENLKRFTLVPASPFQSVADLSTEVIESLTVALAQLLLEKMPGEQKPNWARNLEIPDDISYRQSTELISEFDDVNVTPFLRLSARFNLLIVRCTLDVSKKKDTTWVIGLRFVSGDYKNIDIAEEDWPPIRVRDRIKNELQGVSGSKKLYRYCVDEFKSIIFQKSDGSKKSIGVAYALNVNAYLSEQDRHGGVQTLTTLMSQALQTPDARALRRLVDIVQEIFRSLFQGLGDDTNSLWRVAEGEAAEHRLVNAIRNRQRSEEHSALLEHLKHMEGEDFSGRLKTNSFLAELRFIRTTLQTLADDPMLDYLDTIIGRVHGDMHQKNIIVPSYFTDLIVAKEELKLGRKVAALIDFEAATDTEHAFADLAQLESSLIVFFLEDSVGIKSLTRIVSRIEGEWLPPPGEGLTKRGTAKDDLNLYAEEQFNRDDYNVYEKTAHAIIGTLRRFLHDAIIDMFEERSERAPTHEEMSGYLRQYYVLMFMSTVKLVAVLGAPKAVVVSYAYWLANQLRTDPDLLVEVPKQDIAS